MTAPAELDAALRARAARLAAPVGAVGHAPGGALDLGVGGRRFRFDLEAITSVHPLGPLSPLPAATPGTWLGVATIRGGVVAVLDLAAHLGDPPTELATVAHLVVLTGEGGAVAVAASTVELASDPDGEAVHPPPAGSPAAVRGVTDDLIVVVSASSLLSHLGART